MGAATDDGLSKSRALDSSAAEQTHKMRVRRLAKCRRYAHLASERVRNQKHRICLHKA